MCAQFRNLNHVASFYFVCYKPLVESRINLFTHMHSYCKESDSFKISNWGLHPGVITNLAGEDFTVIRLPLSQEFKLKCMVRGSNLFQDLTFYLISIINFSIKKRNFETDQ